MFKLKKNCLTETYNHIKKLTKQLNEEVTRMYKDGIIEKIPTESQPAQQNVTFKKVEHDKHPEPDDKLKGLFKKVLKKLIRLYHPDKNKNNSEEKTCRLLEVCNSSFDAKELFDIIVEEDCEDILTEEESSSLYNLLLADVGEKIDMFYASLEWKYIRTNDPEILDDILRGRGYKLV
jgi:hypothetical protein